MATLPLGRDQGTALTLSTASLKSLCNGSYNVPVEDGTDMEQLSQAEWGAKFPTTALEVYLSSGEPTHSLRPTTISPRAIPIKTTCVCSPKMHERMLTAAHYLKQFPNGNYPDALHDVYQEEINGDRLTRWNITHQ